MNVLIVEDDQDLRTYLDMMLKHLGHHPLVAHDFSSAVQLLERADVVMMDYQLEHANGADVGRQLRKYRPHIPIVFCTAQSDIRDLYGIRDLNARFVIKPFVRADIEAVLRSIQES